MRYTLKNDSEFSRIADRLQSCQRCVLVPALLVVVVVGTASSASASCGDYLYRNGKPVASAHGSMNQHESLSPEVPSSSLGGATIR